MDARPVRRSGVFQVLLEPHDVTARYPRPVIVTEGVKSPEMGFPVLFVGIVIRFPPPIHRSSAVKLVSLAAVRRPRT